MQKGKHLEFIENAKHPALAVFFFRSTYQQQTQNKAQTSYKKSSHPFAKYII